MAKHVSLGRENTAASEGKKAFYWLFRVVYFACTLNICCSRRLVVFFGHSQLQSQVFQFACLFYLRLRFLLPVVVSVCLSGWCFLIVPKWSAAAGVIMKETAKTARSESDFVFFLFVRRRWLFTWSTNWGVCEIFVHCNTCAEKLGRCVCGYKKSLHLYISLPM